MKIDEAIEIITNAVQTDKMTVEQDEALAIVQRETKKTNTAKAYIRL